MRRCKDGGPPVIWSVKNIFQIDLLGFIITAVIHYVNCTSIFATSISTILFCLSNCVRLPNIKGVPLWKTENHIGGCLV